MLCGMPFSAKVYLHGKTLQKSYVNFDEILSSITHPLAGHGQIWYAVVGPLCTLHVKFQFDWCIAVAPTG